MHAQGIKVWSPGNAVGWGGGGGGALTGSCRVSQRDGGPAEETLPRQQKQHLMTSAALVSWQPREPSSPAWLQRGQKGRWTRQLRGTKMDFQVSVHLMSEEPKTEVPEK